jgi:lipopolysaccharide/colanic/teichoic acid biosynthesis glycosyltransferase
MENSTAPKNSHRSPLRALRLGRPSSERSAQRPRPTAQRLYRARVKRGVDLIAGIALIVLLLPLLLVIALVIRFDSRGPVLFRQSRLGRDMEPFTVLKVRTMAVDSSSELHERYIAELAGSRLNGNGSGNGNGNGRHRENGNGADSIKKLTAAPRVTRVGRFLRRTSIDELPQLFNVVGGSMSLIGPRPALEYEIQYYSPLHFKRFDVRPGITGLWQVSGRNRLDFHEMLDLDAKYSQEATLATDVGILARTPTAAFRHGA